MEEKIMGKCISLFHKWNKTEVKTENCSKTNYIAERNTDNKRRISVDISKS